MQQQPVENKRVGDTMAWRDRIKRSMASKFGVGSTIGGKLAKLFGHKSDRLDNRKSTVKTPSVIDLPKPPKP